MGVSLDCYRMRIGCYQPSHIVSRQIRVKVTKYYSMLTLKFCLAICLLRFPPMNCMPSSFLDKTVTSSQWQPGLMGLDIGLNNKVCHCINGNRSKEGLIVASWNCGRAVMRKIEDIKLFIEKYKPHLVAISEADLHSPNSTKRVTKFSKEEIFETLKIDGYTILLPDTWSLYNQARIIVFASHEINIKQREVPESVRELPNITLEVGRGRERKSLINFFYREWTNGINGDDSTEGQIERFADQVNYWRVLSSENKDLMLLGDANYCALSCTKSDYPTHMRTIANLATDFFLQESLCQLINVPTRTELKGNQVEKSCLDHIVTNVPGKCFNTEVKAAGHSDHLAVMTTKLSKEIMTRSQVVRKRSYKHFEKENFLREIKYTDFEEVIQETEVDLAAAKFSKIFSSVLNNHAPIKIFQNRKNYVPYLSDSIKEEMKLRNALKQQSLFSNDPSKLQEYKMLRNRVKSKLKNEKFNFYTEKLSENQGNVKQLWRTSYQMLGQSKDFSPKKILYNNSIITFPSHLAEAFNEIFVSKVEKVKSKIVGNVNFSPVERLTQWLDKRQMPISNLDLKPINIEDLRRYICKLKGGKSSGVDDIDSFSLRLAAPMIENVLLHIINLAITSGSFASCWKTQLVRPYFKKGDRCLGENYRPVSNIPEISKLVEYAALEQLLRHFLENELFHPNHHGFLPAHSTLTALLQIYDSWLLAAENREFSAGLFLDLSSAFDIIEHGILFDKLQMYGLGEKSIGFFKSYLQQRQQRVQVESKLSSPKELGNNGVPQGSILGPIIFLIYMNDFPEHSVNGENVLYADDSSGHVSAKDPDELIQKLQAFADSSTNWINANQMVCSASKTKLLIVSTKELRESKMPGRVLSVTVGDQIIQETCTEKLLGITMCNNMSWGAYLYGTNSEGLLNQLSQRVGMIRQLSKFMNRDQLNSVVNGLFNSKLLYCLPLFSNVWGIGNTDEIDRRYTAFTKEDMRRLQVLQNKVLRIKCQNYELNTPTSELVRMCGDLSVQQLGVFHTLLQVFKIINSGRPHYLVERLSPRRPVGDHVFPQRRVNTIMVRGDLTLSRSGFAYRGSKLWNSLPTSLRTQTQFAAFKRDLRLWVTSNVPVKPQ